MCAENTVIPVSKSDGEELSFTFSLLTALTFRPAITPISEAKSFSSRRCWKKHGKISFRDYANLRTDNRKLINLPQLLSPTSPPSLLARKASPATQSGWLPVSAQVSISHKREQTGNK